MQVSFNPNIKYNPNFKALTEKEIEYITFDYENTAKFKTDIVRGAKKLEDADWEKIKVILEKLEEKGEKAVSFVLKKILELKPVK